MGTPGTAIVDFTVDTEGNAINVFSARDTDPEFGDSAVEAVKRWKFRPGRIGGRNVATHLQVPIVFTVNEN
jgi:protein TonB